MTAPVWLREEAWLRELLLWFVQRCHPERQRDLTRRVTPRTIPALFDFNQETGYRWQLLQSLHVDYGVFTIHLARTGPGDEPYLNAQLRFNPASEDLLRSWLQQPRIDPYLSDWVQAIARERTAFIDQGQALLNNPLRVAGFSASELVTGFARVTDYLDQPRSARQISARCFAGHSKLLDHRLDLLSALFGSAASIIQPRPLLLNAWAPSQFSQLLLVENQDSFLQLVSQQPAGYALVYSAGFRASAERLISEHTRFAFLPGPDADDFSRRWRSVPSFFWGDLDYAGMAILKALRTSLPDLAAWRPGYQPLLDALRAGHGHRPEQTGKTGQNDPASTGCNFADQQLLPALRQSGHFIDQEWLPLQVICPDADP